MTVTALARSRTTRGQALVEFALVAPVLLLLMLLAIDFGRLFFSYIAVNNAAREATFYAAARAADTSFDLDAYNAGAAAAAAREAAAQGQGGEGSLSITAPTCFSPATATVIDCNVASKFAGGIGNQVTVSVDRPFTFLTPLIGDFFGGQLTLSASATAPVLNPLDVTILADPTPTPSPTPSPSPTPTPSPTPSPTPTPPPGATPTPTPTPAPAPTPTPIPTCTVPDFYHTYWNDIGSLQAWHDESGFTGTLTDDTKGKKTQGQTLAAGSTMPCTASMTVRNRP